MLKMDTQKNSVWSEGEGKQEYRIRCQFSYLAVVELDG